MKLSHFLLVLMVLPALLQLHLQAPAKYATPGLTAAPDKSIMNEDGTTFIEVLANDSGFGKGKITLTIIGAPAHGIAVVNVDNTITYSPYPDYNGIDVVIYQVCNEKNECSTAKAAIIINPVEDIPLIDSMVITQTLNENVRSAALMIPGNSNGAYGTIRTFAIVKNPVYGKVLVDSIGKYVYFAQPKFNGSDTIVYEVCDNGIPYFCSKGMIIMKVNVSNISAVEIIP